MALTVQLDETQSTTSSFQADPSYLAFPQSAHLAADTPTSVHSNVLDKYLEPPTYEQAVFPTVAVVHVSSPQSLGLPPDYQKYSDKTRAERCFCYGFLIFPIWIWGLLHYFPLFSESLSLPDADLPHLPRWNGQPSVHVLTLTPSPPASPSVKPRFFNTILPRRPAQASPRYICRLPSYVQETDEQHRKEERKWALRCGYALAIWWAAALMCIVFALQAGLFGRVL